MVFILNCILIIELVLIIYVMYLLNKNRFIEHFNSVSDNQKIVNIWNKKEFTKENINYINSFATHTRNVKSNTKFNFVIHSIFKNERPFIKEWLDWHLFCLEGVNHIYLYQNGDDARTREIIKPYIDRGLVTLVKYNHIRKEGKGLYIKPQHLCKNHCVDNYGKEYKWILHIDIDEFLVPTYGDNNINKLFELYGDKDHIAIKRVNFGSNNYKKHQESVLLSYTKREKKYSSIKSIAKTNNIKDILQKSCHKWEMNTNNRSTCKNKYFQLNHYYTKSLEDYLKRDSNSKGTGSRKSTEKDWIKKNEKINDIDDFVAYNIYKKYVNSK
tara:strand:+ start:6551 stop:7531 length:981 start_codon:yes stop_codon:yes gene_type:complete